MNLLNLLLLYYPLLKPTLAEIISKSSIQKCYNQTSNSTSQLPNSNQASCADKLLVSLTVENAQTTSTEYIKITQATQGNLTQQLKTPLIISVTKTPVYAYYPIRYNQDYNSNPKEVKIAGSLFSCDDAWETQSPTCGFQYKNGSKIFDSQGFCCSCGILDLVGLSDEYARGNICKAADLTTASMAFCLRYSDLWYSSFHISSFHYYYEITVNLIYADESNERLELGSSKKSASADAVVARIIGDFTPLQQPPALESFYLMVPSYPQANPRVKEGSGAYMIIPKSAVGSGECNKIGVSYSAFRTEGERCKKKVASCLKNQIEDFYQSDLGQIAQGKKPFYKLGRWGSFDQIQKNNETFLRYQVEGQMSTMITLEIDAGGKIEFVTNIGRGVIDFAEVRNFESLSGSGELLAQVTNIGGLSSQFNTFLNCSDGVIPINAEALFLEPLESRKLNRTVNVVVRDKSSNLCNFTLQNNMGTTVDLKMIKFNTTALEKHSDQQFDEQVLTDKEVDASAEIPNVCATNCEVFIDIICYFDNDCNQQIYTFFSVFGAMVLLAAALAICQLVKRSLCCCGGGKKQYREAGVPVFDIIHGRKKKAIQNLSNSQILDEDSMMVETRPSHRQLFVNLRVSSDPVARRFGQDLSVEVLGTFQQEKVVKLQVQKRSEFVQLFADVYGEENLSSGIQKYLESKRALSEQFPSVVTSKALYTKI